VGDLKQFAEAYRTLAALGYRPMAPSDGFGNIGVPVEELEVSVEAREYAKWCLEQDESGQWHTGVPDTRFAQAAILALEAFRLMGAPSILHRDGGAELVPAVLKAAAAEYARGVEQWRRDMRDD
jgi:hypothetical protein